MSFQQPRTFLRDAFPGGATLPCSSVKATVRATGTRLEAEARRRWTPLMRCEGHSAYQVLRELPCRAGYIPSIPRADGTRCSQRSHRSLPSVGYRRRPRMPTSRWDTTNPGDAPASFPAFDRSRGCPTDGSQRRRRRRRLRVSDSLWGRTSTGLVSHRDAIRTPAKPRAGRRAGLWRARALADGRRAGRWFCQRLRRELTLAADRAGRIAGDSSESSSGLCQSLTTVLLGLETSDCIEAISMS